MKLRPRDPTHKLARDLYDFARRAKRKANVKELRQALDLGGTLGLSRVLIVVGNGSPDNRALLALAAALNGGVTVDLVFPEEKLETSLYGAPTYIREGYKILVFTFDQEDRNLDELHENIKKILRELGSSDYTVISERLVMATLEHTRLYIVINGLDEYEFKKHTIEDHLIKVGEVIGELSNPRGYEDPKKLWKSLSEEKQVNILKAIAVKRVKPGQVFPQHVKALKLAVEPGGT